VSPESGGVFIVSLEGVDLHVVCVSVEQALEQAEALSQQRQRRVIVQGGEPHRDSCDVGSGAITTY